MRERERLKKRGLLLGGYIEKTTERWRLGLEDDIMTDIK